jgi:hypothetical protein
VLSSSTGFAEANFERGNDRAAQQLETCNEAENFCIATVGGAIRPASFYCAAQQPVIVWPLRILQGASNNIFW